MELPTKPTLLGAKTKQIFNSINPRVSNSADNIADINTTLRNIDNPCLAIAPTPTLWERFKNLVVPTVYAGAPCDIGRVDAELKINHIKSNVGTLIDESEGKLNYRGTNNYHAKRKHLDVSDQSLIFRAQEEAGFRSKFYNEELMIEAIEEGLSINEAKLIEDLQGKLPGQRVEIKGQELTRDYGYGYDQFGNLKDDLDTITIVLEVDDSYDLRLVTAFLNEPI